MSSPRAVKIDRVVDGVRGPILLLSSIRPGQPDILSLLAKASRGRTMYRIDPVEDLSRPGPISTLRMLAEAYAHQVPRPVAVVGDCAVAALSVELAEALERSERAPLVTVLVDPQWPTEGMVARQFAWMRTEVTGEHHAPGALPPGPRDARLTALTAVLADDIRAMCLRRGMLGRQAELVHDMLLARYRGWLGLLLATAESDRVGRERHAVVVDSVNVAEPGPNEPDGRSSSTATRELIHDLIDRAELERYS